MSIIFWLSFISLCYIFLGYPVLLLFWAHLRGRSVRSGAIEPKVSILIVARNEHAFIRNKLLNLLALDYPAEKLQVVVVSDGSNDGTDEIVREFAPQGVALHSATSARGKPCHLDDQIPSLAGEIIVLMDARQTVKSDCIHKLVQHFADPTVGAVSGELLLAHPAGNVSKGVGIYWRYEKFMRRMESKIDSSVGATGALYAIRKTLFQPIATDTLLDDLLIPMQVVRQGFRVVFEPAAIAQEVASITARTEFRRKVRTIAGNFQLFSRAGWLLRPSDNRIWLQTLSHKVGRLTAPVWLLLLMVSNLVLLTHPFFWFTLCVQLVFYSAAISGAVTERLGKTARVLTVPYTFCLLNWATVIGFGRFILRLPIQWK